MAIRPSDLGGGKVTRQGYQLDTDLMPVSEYVREISGSPFTTFEEEIQLFHSTTEADFNVSLLATALAVNQAPKNGKKAKPDEIAFEKMTKVAVSAGDEARGMLATVRFGDGTIVNEGFVLVRVGSIVAFVSVGTPGNVTIPPKVLVQVARLAADTRELRAEQDARRVARSRSDRAGAERPDGPCSGRRASRVRVRARPPAPQESRAKPAPGWTQRWQSSVIEGTAFPAALTSSDAARRGLRVRAADVNLPAQRAAGQPSR